MKYGRKMKTLVTLILVVASFLGGKAEEESAHDVIMRLNQKAVEEDLTFGVGGETQPPLIEGDIVDSPLTRERMEEERRVADGGASGYDALNGGKWPGGVVPYVFGSVGSYARGQIEKAIAEYNAKTCVRFIPRRKNERGYVIFNQGRGCYSMIGRTGGRQEISIGRGCESLGTVIHEMMHAIGFYHEQSRRDRDNYVKIYWNNISKNMQFNFNMYRQGQASTHNEPYDKKSVMHYSRYSFSINRRPTIVSKTNENEVLGNNRGFTEIDVRQIRKHYQCSGTNPNPNPNPKPQPSNCKDISPEWRCRRYKHNCQTNDYVAKRCQKTCGFCS